MSEPISVEQCRKELGVSEQSAPNIGWCRLSVYSRWNGLNRDNFRDLLKRHQNRLVALIQEIEKGCVTCSNPWTVSEAAYQEKVAEAIKEIGSRKP